MRRVHWRVIAMIGVVALALIGAAAPALADPLPLPPDLHVPIPLGGLGGSESSAPGPESAAPAGPAAAPPSLVNVGPKIQVGVCGNGLGVLGIGVT